MRRILVLGIVAALLIGVLVATATASVEQTVEGVDDSPMTIPSGKVGDRAVYAYFFDAPEATAEEKSTSGGVSGESSRSSSSGSGSSEMRASGVETTVIERVGKSVDRGNRIHEVVVVRSNMTFEGFESTSVQYVELAQRTLIRSDSKYEHSFGGRQTMASSYFSEPGGTPYFPHQGKTYELGQEVPAPTSDDWCFGSSMSMGGGISGGIGGLGSQSYRVRVDDEECRPEWAPTILSARSWVAARGVVDGHDAYDIRTDMVLEAPEITMTASSDGSHTTSVARVLEVRLVTDEWVSGDSPYVLLQETVAYVGEEGKEQESRSQRVLQAYEPGNDAIPWKNVPLPPAPTLERSPATASFPADGTNSKLPYKLSQALLDIEGLTAPPAFTAWRQVHPTAKLVSAQHTIGENSRDAQTNYMWILVFAEPSGAGYQVGVERIGSLGQPLITDRGETNVGAFQESDRASGLVTIAEAERAWSILAPEPFTSAGANYVMWGLQVDYAEGPTCLGSQGGEQPADPAHEFRTLYVGRVSFGSCMESSTDIVVSLLAYDVDEGELLVLLEVHQSFDMRGAEVQPRSADIKPASTMTNFQVAKPDVAVATVTSTSLLALFLVGYFLPALKVVGAQALLLVPGYAKLRKDAILDNKIRDQILDLVKQDPGASITDLAKKVDAGWGTVVYHLGVLEKNKMVSTVLDGRHRRVFPVGLVDFSGQGQLALLKNERVRALYDLIHEQPGAFQDQLAKRIGISAPATSWHLKRLEDAGLVGRVKDGRRVHYYANEAPKAHDQDGMEVA